MIALPPSVVRRLVATYREAVASPDGSADAGRGGREWSARAPPARIWRD